MMKSNLKLGEFQLSGFGGFGNHMSLLAKRQRVKNAYFGYGAEFIQKLPGDSAVKPKIIVLTSPGTYSAAFHLTWFLKCLGRTTVIGVASRQAGNSFMETTPFQLPSTGLTGSIANSVQVLFPNVGPGKGKVLKPDAQMKWADFKQFNFDSHSEVLKAIQLIQKGVL